MSKHDIEWIAGGREARCAPNPAYPDGIDVDARLQAPMCFVKLPYPAPRVGAWRVVCETCGVSVAVTAAGRRDDPRSVRIPCGVLGATGEFPEGKLDESDEGALQLAVAREPETGLVHINFGKPVAWLALPPEKALELGAAIINKAKDA